MSDKPCDRMAKPPYTDCRSIQILCEEVDSLCDRFTAHVALFERRLVCHVTAQERHRTPTVAPYRYYVKRLIRFVIGLRHMWHCLRDV